MAHMPEAEEIEALKKALAEAMGALRVVRTERDLLQEQLNHFKRQLFAARSEAGATNVSGHLTAPVCDDRRDDQWRSIAIRQGNRASKSSTVFALGSSTNNVLRYR